jgi:type II secretory pathway pseudopilin PulG
MKNRGFTLVETIISFALILMTAFVVLNVLPSGRRGLQLSENHMNAAYIARSALDETRRMDFLKIAPISGSYVFSGVNNNAATTQAFIYNTDMTDLQKDKKLVWATVSWKEGTGNKTITLETIIFNRNGN